MITRLALDAYGARRAGDFGSKTPDSGGAGGEHPVGVITRLALDGYGFRRVGSFAGRGEAPAVVVATLPGGGWFGKKKKRPAQRETRRKPLHDAILDAWRDYERSAERREALNRNHVTADDRNEEKFCSARPVRQLPRADNQQTHPVLVKASAVNFSGESYRAALDASRNELEREGQTKARRTKAIALLLGDVTPVARHRPAAANRRGRNRAIALMLAT